MRRYIPVQTVEGRASRQAHADLPTDTSDESYNEVVLGATYNISSAMYTFIEGAWYDRSDDEGNGVAVGAVYAF